MNTSSDILIVGAGAAGLAAGRHLARNGKQVIILEARNRTGGRIFSSDIPGLSPAAELGAEFIHGRLPHTLQLLYEAGIPILPAGGQTYQCAGSRWQKQEGMIEEWSELIRKASLLEKDTTLDDFIQRYFSGCGYEQLRQSVRRFTEGFEAADPALAGVFGLRKEWEVELDHQYRVDGGYGRMIHFLQEAFEQAGGSLMLVSPVTRVQWGESGVVATVGEKDMFQAARLLVTVPLGVLQQGSIAFEPQLPAVTREAIENIGFGTVIKLLYHFKEPVWERDDLDRAGILFAHETIPAWWTQYPSRSQVLTGWLSGPAAGAWCAAEERELISLGFRCMARMFSRKEEELQQLVTACKVCNWGQDPWAMGAYSYDYPYSERSRRILAQSLADRLWFAGEACYTGLAGGTVEAALDSGLQAAERILASYS